MTPQVASKVLDMFLDKQCDLKRTEFAYSNNEVWAAVNMASEALEKQIPKKPILKETQCFDGSTADFVLICPVCNRTICREPEDDVIADHIKEEYPHCNCGQALDWSDTE